MTYDFLIIGGGIAGVSAAARLSHLGRVLLLEAEDHLAHHASGRSAALFEPRYGLAPVVALSYASEDHLVSADGGARWCPPDAPAGRPFAPMRWQAIGGIVCLDGECDGRGLALLTSAPARGSPELDRLSAWLRWLDRGGPAVAAPAGTCIPAVRPHLPRT